MLITVTEAAKSHFTSLIKNQINSQTKDIKAKNLNLRIWAIQPGTRKADITLSFCSENEQESSDIVINLGNFFLYVDKGSEQALIDSIVDYIEDHASGSGKVHIKAPFLKVPKFNHANLRENGGSENTQQVTNNDLFEQIKDFLNTEVNPSLARHSGIVKLQSLNNTELGVEVILQFGGGCQGCSMVDFTLKQGIEKSLRNKFSQIVLIKDVTDHKSGKNPFCK